MWSDEDESRDEPSPHSRHARDGRRQLTASEVKRARVWQVVQMMIRGEFERGTTPDALAEEWEIPVATVHTITAEASRTAEFLAGDRTAVLEALRARLHDISAQDGPDRVQAIRTLLEHMGELWQRQRHEVHIKRDPLSDWTEDEVRAYAETGELPAREGDKAKG
jgi:hypothetical protein